MDWTRLTTSEQRQWLSRTEAELAEAQRWLFLARQDGRGTLGPEITVEALKNRKPKLTAALGTSAYAKPASQSATPKPSDYGHLLIANVRRMEAWKPTAQWNQLRRDVFWYAERNKRAQLALVAAEMAALELGIQPPDVRAWSGYEKDAHQKCGWVQADKCEINICLSTIDCRKIVTTCAHEVKHVQQFSRFRNLTSEERERDAERYEKDFEKRVFGA